MKHSRLVGALVFLLPLVTFLAPVIYGLNEYDWSLSSVITPHYTLPKMGLKLKPEPPRLSDTTIILMFQVNNIGEVELKIMSLDGVVYLSDGTELGRFKLIKPITLSPGSSEDLALSLEPGGRAISRLISKLMKGEHVKMLVEGIAQVKVLGSTAELPISESIEVEAKELGVKLCRFAGS